ncbi:MAG: ubiquinone biosynthesis protein [Gammaproteobacteria bacterium]|nr:ubiquinone biosynthesis protein [Gammaproteobacteria bacterium]
MEYSFLSTILSFPALILSGLLGIVLLYWVLVILGALDIELLGGGDADGGDASGDEEGFGALLAFLGLGGVPFTIAISLLVLCAWALAAICTHYLILPIAGTPWRLAAGLAGLLASLWLGAYVAALFIRPLRRVFVTQEVHARDRLEGKVCTITTLRVDENFGQGNYDDGGAGFILSVRARTPNNLTKGVKAVILEYNTENDTYAVIPYNEIMD